MIFLGWNIKLKDVDADNGRCEPFSRLHMILLCVINEIEINVCAGGRTTPQIGAPDHRKVAPGARARRKSEALYMYI